MRKAKFYNREYSLYRPNEKRGEGGYINFGNDNLFPQKLINLYNYSSTHAGCVMAKTQATIGNGLVSEQEGILDVANPMESWNDIWRKITYDQTLFGGFALQIIWSKDRTKIAEVYHVDYSYVRAEYKDNYGKIPGYYLNSDWARNSSYSDDVTSYLPAYNPSMAYEQPKQLYVYHPYRPGMEYYPLPDYMGAYHIIALDAEVDNFHMNNVKNGLAPSLAITTFTNASPEEQEWIERALRAQYGGSENAGSLLYMDVESQEQAPVITPIPTNGNDAYYELMQGMIQQKILTGHRITSPMILGIKTEGQLGGRDEMLDAYLLFMNSVINPTQAALLGCIEKLLEVNYDEVTIGVETTQLFDDGSVETDVVVSDDSNEADSDVLEETTETETTE